MEATTHTEFCKNFLKLTDAVCKDHTPIIVTRPGATRPVVILSLEDYNSAAETVYLLKSPRNKQRLSKALVDLKKKKYSSKKLIEV